MHERYTDYLLNLADYSNYIIIYVEVNSYIDCSYPLPVVVTFIKHIFEIYIEPNFLL